MSEVPDVDPIIKMLTSDGQLFEQPQSVCSQSVTLKNMCDDMPGNEDTIPLPIVDGPTMATVLEYCVYHATHATHTTDTKEWDAAFTALPHAKLFALVLAGTTISKKSKDINDLISSIIMLQPTTSTSRPCST